MLLLLLAHGLKRHKRRAWRAAVILLPVGALAQFAYRHSIVGVLVSLTLCWLLVRHRDQFRALPDPRSRWRALANFVLLGAGSLGLGLIVVSVHPGRVVGDPSIADRLQHVLYGLFGVEGPVDYAGRTGWTVAYSLGALGLLTAVTTIYLAFRPEHPAARLTEDDSGCGSCWTGTAAGTRSATSRSAATRPSSSPPAARPPSAIGSSPG
ncbi:hypothetical protein SBADM41S_03968 [Streptomyces badius]